MNPELETKILQMVEDVLAQKGLELVDLSVRQTGNVYGVEVLTDKPAGGINLDECAAVSKNLEAKIDQSVLLYDNYTLAVSSPGLDRPLKTRKDFLRIVRCPVRIHLREKVHEKFEHQGVVQGADNINVMLLVQEQQLLIPLDQITKAVQII